MLEREAEANRRREAKTQRKEELVASKAEMGPGYLAQLEDRNARKRKRKLGYQLQVLGKRLAKRGLKLVKIDKMKQVEQPDADERPRKAMRMS